MTVITERPTNSMQLRCKSQLQGIIKEYPNGKRLLEVRCKNKWCAARGTGVVVLHLFNVETGELDHTKRFRDPQRPEIDERLSETT